MTRGLPSGTVTLALGDVESSTERWEASAEEMAAAMKALNALIDELVTAHNGGRPLEQGEGDNFVAAFGRASDGVGFAQALQGRSPLPLRMGIHTGDVDVTDDGYAGPAIIRAARLRDAGHGGQVLLSQTTAALVADHVELDDLGEHHLKGLTRPERVWQLPGEFPPLRLTDDAPGVPPRLTAFVGRGSELAHVRDLVKEPGCVTVTGAGGAGKTRLALELIAARTSTQEAPTWFVDLASIDRDANVEAAAVDAVSARSTPGRSPADSIAAVVRDRDALIVFDNCEHVLGACSALASDLLLRCPNLTVLATSREPLGLTGEVTYRLPSLAEAEAIALFVERAQRADPRFALDAATAPLVAEICERLDGMPLAIELAAARTRVFSVAQLLEVLHDRFRLLTGGARTALPRQRTLEASVDWSYALLLEPERVLLRRLSVFAGGFTLEAAAGVAADGDLEAHHVFDLLVQLVEKSLVTHDADANERFRMLETIRHYAAARLVDAGEADACRRRHYEFFVQLVRRRARHDDGELAYLARLHAEDANLRRALQWATDQPGYETLAALALPLAGDWRHARHAREVEATMRELADRTQDAPAHVRARVLCELAGALTTQSRFAEQAQLAPQAVELARVSGDKPTLLRVLTEFYSSTTDANSSDPAVFDEAIALARELGDERSEAIALSYRGFYWMREGGSFENAKPLLHAALLLARKHRMDRLEGAVLAWLCMGGIGVDPAPVEDFERAATLLEATGQALILSNLYALSACRRASAGDDAGADRDLAKLDALAIEVDDLTMRINQSIGHGGVALIRGDVHAAARHLTLFSTIPAAWGLLAVLIELLALAEALSGQLDEAEQHALSVPALEGDAVGLLRSVTALALAEVAHRRGDHGRAWELALTAATSDEVTRSTFRPYLVAAAGRGACHLGRAEEGLRVIGAASAVVGGIFGGKPQELGLWNKLVADTIDSARAELGDATADGLLDAGAALDIEEALGLLQRGRGSRQRPLLGWDSLTPTEAQVAALVAKGTSNKDVAAQLFMSEATVKTHLTRIYNKVGVSNRAQLAASARRPS